MQTTTQTANTLTAGTTIRTLQGWATVTETDTTRNGLIDIEFNAYDGAHIMQVPADYAVEIATGTPTAIDLEDIAAVADATRAIAQIESLTASLNQIMATAESLPTADGFADIAAALDRQIQAAREELAETLSSMTAPAAS